jgi:thymidine phosphorylase
VAAQGGDVSVLGDPPSMKPARLVEPVRSSRTGVVAEIDAMAVGLAAVAVGAGRMNKGDPVDHAVGIVLAKGRRPRAGRGETVHYLCKRPHQVRPCR